MSLDLQRREGTMGKDEPGGFESNGGVSISYPPRYAGFAPRLTGENGVRMPLKEQGTQPPG